MLTTIIGRVVDGWTKAGVVQESDRDSYIYGLDLLLFTMLNLLVVTGTAAICGKLPDTLVLLAVVIPLQAVGGGYHAETHLRCFLIMFIGWWVVVPTIPLLAQMPIVATVTVCVSLVVIFVFAPVPHVNAPMSSRRRKRMRMYSRVYSVTIAFLSISIIWIGLDYTHMGTVVAVGLSVTALSMLCARIKFLAGRKRIQGHGH